MEYPANVEAEQAYLASIFVDNGVFVDTSDVLCEEDFYRGDTRIIYAAMRELVAAKTPVEIVTVTDFLHRHRQLDAAGGIAGITQIAGLLPTATHASHYAKIIADCARRRKLMRYAAELSERAQKGEESTDELAQDITGKISGAVITGASDGVKSSSAWTSEMLGWLVDRAESDGEDGIPTGFPALDEVTHGWQRKNLIFLAARPAMGKTALALNFATAAAERGRSVAIFSLEMGKEELAARILAAKTMTPLSKILHPRALDEAESNRVQDQLDEMGAKWRLFIDDTATTTLPQIAAKARRIKAKDGLDLVIIDYLQLMTSEGRSENRVQEISKITRGLKGMAKDLDCPVICLSQLSRQVESRTDKHPVLSDLRESGSIEQDADIVMFLYRDDYYNPGADRKPSELKLAKHRNGRCGAVLMDFLKSNQLFVPAAQDYFGGTEVSERNIPL